jgi:hypothetical protein
MKRASFLQDLPILRVDSRGESWSPVRDSPLIRGILVNLECRRSVIAAAEGRGQDLFGGSTATDKVVGLPPLSLFKPLEIRDNW